MPLPARTPRPLVRLGVVLAISIALHASLWLVTRALPPRPPPRPRENLSVSVREKPDTKPPEPPPPGPATPPSPKPQLAQTPKSRPPEPSPPPPAKPTPQVDSPTTPDETPAAPIANKVGPTAPPGPLAAPGAPDLGKIRLFDANALGLAIQRSNPGLAVSDRLQLGGDDPDSATATSARIQSRLEEQLTDAMSAANVATGFASACDDGIDNNIDGEIDCADPGCRQLALCDFTGVYEDDSPKAIPDGEGSLQRTVRVSQEGRVRKLALSIDLMHASPGDLAITLVAPDGHKAVVRRADRGDFVFKKAYYVRPLLGTTASGDWTLVLEDRYGGVRGVLRGWRLYVTS